MEQPCEDHAMKHRDPCRLLWSLWLVTCCLWAVVTPAQAQRVALLIGNAAYQAGPLRNPPNDLQEIGSSLKSVGFRVQTVLNVNQNQMKRAVRDFGALAQGAEIAFVYYSGHANQANGENYLIPLGAVIEKEADYEVEAVSANALMRQISGARPRAAIVVLDACRDNPFAAVTRGTNKGLGRMDAPSGTMIAFATAPNSTAGDEGHYARVLAAQIRVPGLELFDVFRNTTIEVQRLTDGRQIPRVSEVSITDRIYLAGPPRADSSSQSPPVDVATVSPARPPVAQRPESAPTHGATEWLVKIASVGPLSGAQTNYGKDNLNGVRMAVDDLNARGVRIGGRLAQFEVVAEDDAADPRQGVAIAQKLCSARVHAVVGHLNSGTTIPASAVYQQCGLPHITPSATNPKLTAQGFSHSFRLLANDNALGAGLAAYSADRLRLTKVAILDDRTAYGAGVADTFRSAAQAKGLQIVDRQFTNDKAVDFMPQLLSIKSKSPDAIFYGGMDTQAGPLLKQMDQLGMSDVRLLGGDGICTRSLATLSNSGASLSKVLCAEGGSTLANMAGGAAWKARYDAKYPGQFQVYSVYTYDATFAFVDAMVRAGSPDPSIYVAKLRSIDYQGVTQRIRFDAIGELINPSMTFYQYVAGRKQPLTP